LSGFPILFGPLESLQDIIPTNDLPFRDFVKTEDDPGWLASCTSFERPGVQGVLDRFAGEVVEGLGLEVLGQKLGATLHAAQFGKNQLDVSHARQLA
jgi:hypothetical protein